MVKGIVRNIDHLGRITLPIEMRRSMKANVGDPVDIYFKNGVICVETCKLQCVLCGSKNEDKLVVRNGVHVCTECIEEMAVHIDRVVE